MVKCKITFYENGTTKEWIGNYSSLTVGQGGCKFDIEKTGLRVYVVGNFTVEELD